MFKHVFLILNYNTKEMTLDLAKFIINKGYHVVVVDNDSIDDSYNYLCQELGKTDVDILKTPSNLGFASGNNYGYDYIINNISEVDYVHCINSDVLFDDFEALMNKINSESGSYIIGPNVIHNDLRTSPLQVRNLNTIVEDNKKDMNVYRNKILKHKFGRMLGPFYYQYMKSNDSFKQKQDFPHYQHELKNNEYYVLNGCYLVFSRLYMDKFDRLFDSRTFLYCEEEILFYQMKKQSFKVSYFDDVRIYHLEGVSSVDSIIFKYKQLLKSSEVFKKILGGE